MRFIILHTYFTFTATKWRVDFRRKRNRKNGNIEFSSILGRTIFIESVFVPVYIIHVIWRFIFYVNNQYTHVYVFTLVNIHTYVWVCVYVLWCKCFVGQNLSIYLSIYFLFVFVCFLASYKLQALCVYACKTVGAKMIRHTVWHLLLARTVLL